ncbi:MAG: hypothetical protein QWI73_06380 [Alphaproteobacteria bacterium]|nr:hypothetical protein [Alphaproteobacteria bacterium]
MIECALFGVAKQKFEWNGEEFERAETVYKAGKSTVLLIEERISDVKNTHLVCRELLDRNRQRRSVIFKVHRSRIPEDVSSEDLLNAIGYSPVSKNIVSGIRYARPRYTVELTQSLSAKESINEYLVKAFVESENIPEGEACLDEAYSDIADYAQITKPPLVWFE